MVKVVLFGIAGDDNVVDIRMIVVAVSLEIEIYKALGVRRAVFETHKYDVRDFKPA